MLVELIGWFWGLFCGWFGFQGLDWEGGGGKPFLKNTFLKRRIWRAEDVEKGYYADKEDAYDMRHMFPLGLKKQAYIDKLTPPP